MLNILLLKSIQTLSIFFIYFLQIEGNNCFERNVINLWEENMYTNTHLSFNRSCIILNVIPFSNEFFELNIDYNVINDFLSTLDVEDSKVLRKKLEILLKSKMDIINSDKIMNLLINIKKHIDNLVGFWKKIKLQNEKAYNNQIKKKWKSLLTYIWSYMKDKNICKNIKRIEYIANYSLYQIEKTKILLEIEEENIRTRKSGFTQSQINHINTKFEVLYNKWLQYNKGVDVFSLFNIHSAENSIFSEQETFAVQFVYFFENIEKILRDVKMGYMKDIIELPPNYDYQKACDECMSALDYYDFIRYIYLNNQLYHIAKLEKEFYEIIGDKEMFDVSLKREIFFNENWLIGIDNTFESYANLIEDVLVFQYEDKYQKIMKNKFQC
ncbi:hypothetical protein SLOPH_810 [Spraguea lophii 42_110]|uniref:Uncharacterized protein n=1 Tax=Spraguea lophii (strain 42_110) TaxID=1358809 RepID=S7XJZ2_SPRLO|nr:hypothetical protein SLOPH_810 [Spraguea lophii 42_110]